MSEKKCKICGSPAHFTFSRGWTGQEDIFPYFQCENFNCQFLYTNYLDKMTNEEISNIYSISAWEDGMNRKQSGQLTLEKVNLAKVILPNAKRVLDVGSGRGWGVAALREAGFDAYGYDVSSPDICHEYITCARESVSGKYDIITALEVLEHLIDPIEACQWIATLLNEEGVFIFSTYPFNPKRHDENWWYLDHLGHVSLHTKKSLRLLADATGFRVVADIIATHVWIYGHSSSIGSGIQLKINHVLRKIADPAYIRFATQRLKIDNPLSKFVKIKD
jgi:SAM-dependent methyltransferase